MQITDVSIKLIDIESNKLKCVCSIVLDSVFVIHDIKVIDNSGKLFLAMPNKKLSNGEYKDIVHPLNSEFRDYIKTVVLQAYENALASTLLT